MTGPELWVHPLQPESIALQTALRELGFPHRPMKEELQLAVNLDRFAARWPEKRKPVLFLKDCELAGFTAILDYAHLARAAGLAPDDTECLSWARALADAEHRLHEWALGLDKLVLEDNPEERLPKSLSWLNERLQQQSWLGGERIGVADCWAAAGLLSSAMRNRLGKLHALNDYFQRWLERDSYIHSLRQANRLMLRYCGADQTENGWSFTRPELIEHFYHIGLIGPY